MLINLNIFCNLLKINLLHMKNLFPSVKLLLSLMFIFAFTTSANSQILKKLGKRAEKAAERAIERRVEKESSKKTEEVLDSIFEPGKKGKQPTDNDGNKIPRQENPDDTNNNPNKNSETENSEESNSKSNPQSLQVYSKFDFVPGDKLLFYDDFKDDFVGDFPSQWNTNGSGEIVTIGNSPEKWFELKSKSAYYANISNLPEDYTIEFDVKVVGVDKKTSSNARLIVNLRDDDSFHWYQTGDNGVVAKIPLTQYTDVDIHIWNRINKSTIINNGVESDIRESILAGPHISIAVNGTRFRLWVNETKYLELPKIVPSNILKYFRFDVRGLEDGKEHLLVNNIKIAEGGVDLRRKLMSEGKISTNGILFDTGSANIQPQSMGIIRQINQVLLQDASINLKIVGHTDGDGSNENNMTLSEKRASAVMKTLITIYNVAPDRLLAEGLGESQPVGDNNTVDGKALNRRVEFIKL